MITPSWQIYLPQRVRKALDLKIPGKVTFAIRGDSMVITPKKSPLLSLGGKYRRYSREKNIDLANIRDHIDYRQI